MKRDLKILCQAYIWDSDVELKDCNFFSGVTGEILGDKIDLTEFISIDSKVSITREVDQAISDSGRPALYFVAGDIELELLDNVYMKDKTSNEYEYLHNYFFYYTNSVALERVKFMADIYYKDILIAKGTIIKESLQLFYKPDDKNRTLTLTIILYEKEFKDYYSNVGLLDTGTLVFTETKPSGGKYLPLQNVLEALFPAVTVNIIEQSIKDWRVCQEGEMYIASTGSTLYFNRNGYKQVYQSNENRFEFLSKLCMAMGWVFMLEPGEEDMQLVIMNRNTFDSSITNLQVSMDMVLQASVTKISDIETFEYIVINNGTMIGGNNCFPNGHSVQINHRGERQIIITYWREINNYPYHFSSVAKSGSSYSFSSSAGDKFIKYYGETAEDYIYDYYIYTSGSDNYKRQYALPKLKTLFINAGDNNASKRRIQLTDHGQADYYDGETPLDDYDLVYTGNYGEMLYQENSGSTYQYYNYGLGTAFHNIKANQLSLNYDKYLTRENNKFIIDCVINIFEPSPWKIIKFIGDVEQPFNAAYQYQWLISSIEADVDTDTTKFKLIGRIV